MYIYIYTCTNISKLPAARFRFGPGRRGGCAKERFHFGEGPRHFFCWCFADMGALRMFMLKRFKISATYDLNSVGTLLRPEPVTHMCS